MLFHETKKFDGIKGSMSGLDMKERMSSRDLSVTNTVIPLRFVSNQAPREIHWRISSIM